MEILVEVSELYQAFQEAIEYRVILRVLNSPFFDVTKQVVFTIQKSSD